ncbi:MAG: hypothetical protein K2K92_05435 [Duncaniella sp.]|nr:hypothetical protein [Duncaniella sp.]
MASAENILYITVGSETLTATLEDNSATQRLVERLKTENIIVNMHDYGGFEKVGALPWSLPTSDRQLTTSAGDIMLYLGDNIVFFYGSNSWDYTPLGHFDNITPEALKSFLSGSNISAILSLSPQSGLTHTSASSEWNRPLTVFDLAGRAIEMRGRRLADLPRGVYIVNGEKRYIR